jgi:hypothetical protein
MTKRSYRMLSLDRVTHRKAKRSINFQCASGLQPRQFIVFNRPTDGRRFFWSMFSIHISMYYHRFCDINPSRLYSTSLYSSTSILSQLLIILVYLREQTVNIMVLIKGLFLLLTFTVAVEFARVCHLHSDIHCSPSDDVY